MSVSVCYVVLMFLRVFWGLTWKGVRTLSPDDRHWFHNLLMSSQEPSQYIWSFMSLLEVCSSEVCGVCFSQFCIPVCATLCLSCARSWMVYLLEPRANGQLPRFFCLEVAIIHWPQIYIQILPIARCKVQATMIYNISLMPVLLLKNVNGDLFQDCFVTQRRRTTLRKSWYVALWWPKNCSSQAQHVWYGDAGFIL